MVRRHEFTDQAWAEIALLLPTNGRPGGQWADHRQVVNGILWKLATGVPWRDLPERYGPWQTCYERFRRWQADGTWQRPLAHAQTRSDADLSLSRADAGPSKVGEGLVKWCGWHGMQGSGVSVDWTAWTNAPGQ